MGYASPTVTFNNTLPATKNFNAHDTFNVLQYFTNATITFDTLGQNLISNDIFQVKMSPIFSGQVTYAQFNTATSTVAVSNVTSTTASGTGYSSTGYTTYNQYGISTNMMYVGTSQTSSTSANGKLQLKASAGGKNIDGASFQAYSDTNNIINFLNASGTLRGAINGSSASAVTYSTSSDRRLKTNIETMPSQLENIKKLNARAFKWKETNQDDYGFIAQEIYSVYEHLRPYNKYEDKENPTKEDGSPWIYGVDYGKMTPYLWSGLQELIYEVENLKRINNPTANKFIIHDQLAITRKLKKQVDDQQSIIDQQKQLIQNLTLSNNELISDIYLLKSQVKNIMNCLISKNIYS
jgi:hypothetical protein